MVEISTCPDTPKEAGNCGDIHSECIPRILCSFAFALLKQIQNFVVGRRRRRNGAAIRIQSVFRGYCVRIKAKRIRDNAAYKDDDNDETTMQESTHPSTHFPYQSTTLSNLLQFPPAPIISASHSVTRPAAAFAAPPLPPTFHSSSSFFRTEYQRKVLYLLSLFRHFCLSLSSSSGPSSSRTTPSPPTYIRDSDDAYGMRAKRVSVSKLPSSVHTPSHSSSSSSASSVAPLPAHPASRYTASVNQFFFRPRPHLVPTLRIPNRLLPIPHPLSPLPPLPPLRLISSV